MKGLRPSAHWSNKWVISQLHKILGKEWNGSENNSDENKHYAMKSYKMADIKFK